MAGGSIAHAELSLAVASALREQLRGQCRVFSSDLRVRVPATGLASYPDATVVCGPIERDPDSEETVVNPTVLVEVLSESTEDYDLGERFDHYKRLDSLEAVLFVSQDVRRLEVRQRRDDWKPKVAQQGETLEMSSPSCSIEVDAVYEGVV